MIKNARDYFMCVDSTFKNEERLNEYWLCDKYNMGKNLAKIKVIGYGEMDPQLIFYLDDPQMYRIYYLGKGEIKDENIRRRYYYDGVQFVAMEPAEEHFLSTKLYNMAEEYEIKKAAEAEKAKEYYEERERECKNLNLEALIFAEEE